MRPITSSTAQRWLGERGVTQMDAAAVSQYYLWGDGSQTVSATGAEMPLKLPRTASSGESTAPPRAERKPGVSNHRGSKTAGQLSSLSSAGHLRLLLLSAILYSHLVAALVHVAQGVLAQNSSLVCSPRFRGAEKARCTWQCAAVDA